jgi:hypothetical protein
VFKLTPAKAIGKARSWCGSDSAGSDADSEHKKKRTLGLVSPRFDIQHLNTPPI